MLYAEVHNKKSNERERQRIDDENRMKLRHIQHDDKYPKENMVRKRKKKKINKNK
jgi:hypothetical protein